MNFKVGDRVVVSKDDANGAKVNAGDTGTIYSVTPESSYREYIVTMDINRKTPPTSNGWFFRNQDIKLISKVTETKQESKMKDFFTDIKGFIKEHRTVIYAVSIIIVLDHFLLDGKLRGKIEGLLSSSLDKIKGKLDAE